MIKIMPKKGDLLAVQAGHIVHGCNAQGVMGSGVAFAVKKKYPLAFDNYAFHHSTPEGLILGNTYPFEINNKLVIWNAITQEGYGPGTRQVSYDAIQTCFEQINFAIERGWYPEVPEEVHIPMIGAGLGGGNWAIISTIIEQTMDYPVTLWLLPTV